MLDYASMRNEIVSMTTTKSVGIRIMLHIKLCACFDETWRKIFIFNMHIHILVNKFCLHIYYNYMYAWYVIYIYN